MTRLKRFSKLCRNPQQDNSVLREWLQDDYSVGAKRKRGLEDDIEDEKDTTDHQKRRIAALNWGKNHPRKDYDKNASDAMDLVILSKQGHKGSDETVNAEKRYIHIPQKEVSTKTTKVIFKGHVPLEELSQSRILDFSQITRY